MTRSSTESKTSLAIATNLSELELKKILIDKMESNKSIYRSNEQKNLYKALVETYESDKLILDTYGDTLSTPKEKTPKSTGKSTERSKSLYKSAGESAHAEEPIHTAKDLEEPAHQEFETRATKISQLMRPLSLLSGFRNPLDFHLPIKKDPREPFNELMDTPLDFSAFEMNRLKVDTLTLELLTGPTFELMKGSCKSQVELEYLFEKVYKATTEQLDWNNPQGDAKLPKRSSNLTQARYVSDLDLNKKEVTLTAYSNPRGFIYQNKDKKNRLMRIDELHKYSDGTLNDVQTALNDRLKGIQIEYLPQTIWRQSYKDKAGAMSGNDK
ncbi:hypothetical protein Tco_0662218 [Tanacetum coccineum]